MELLAALWTIVRMLPQAFTDANFLLLVLLLMLLVHGQYSRASRLEIRVFGRVRQSPLLSSARALLYGLVGGLLATLLFVTLGISLTGTSFISLLLLAVILALVHPRLMCFSYAGGFLSLFHLMFGTPEIDVPVVMAVVAILHLVEALLITLQGHEYAVPIYVEQSKGHVVGGFVMQKFWPVPFVALMAVAVLEGSVDWDVIAMPDWWPLMTPNAALPPQHALIFFLAPVAAVLGYGDMVVTALPKKKCRQSATSLFVFSVALLGLAMSAAVWPIMAWVAALFAPVGHEWVIHRGQESEKSGQAVFTAAHGLMVLDVHPGTPAAQMQLRPGDVIRAVNDHPVANAADLLAEMTPWIIDPWFEVENVVDGERRRQVHYKGKMPPVGIIPVPESTQAGFLSMGDENLFTWWQRKFGGRKG